MFVSYLPYFVAKTDRPDAPLPRSFKICSLREFAGDLEEGSLLCPVRSLRVYLEHTKSTVVPRASSRQISKNAVLFFLREVISGAGAARGDVVTPLRAHSIRGVATSTVFIQSCWSVSKVLEAASWRSNSVFASFYLYDVQYVMEGLRSLWPIVAAGSVLP